MNTGEKDRLCPELSARIAALSPERRALLERLFGATAPIAVARRSEPAAVARRHDSPGTTFRLEGGGAVQEISSDLPVRMDVADLEAVSTEERQAGANRRALPVSGGGKLDRQTLSSWTAQDFDGPGEIAPGTEPQELGDHSLLAIRAIDRLNGAFLVSLTIRDLFENLIVSDPARVVERAQAAGEHAYPPSIPRMAHGAATSPGANSTN